jgi:transcriptional regulator with GAF, ATPase, and Fis domain
MRPNFSESEPLRYGQLLLALWREACRHTEIDEALAESAPWLFARLPVDVVLVRRFDIARKTLETVARGNCRPTDLQGENRTSLNDEELASLLEWCSSGRVAACNSRAASDVASRAIPGGLTGQFLIGPLTSDAGPQGVLILAFAQEASCRPRYERAVRLLLEPFSVWLENDRRLRELNVLREAAEADNRSLLSRLGRNDISESIIGERTGLKEVMAGVDRVARTDVPVLILGETGSGKEVVARAIHERSSRAGGPFLRVNCGAIPPELIDSELFGHERGSFSGAVGQRKGWFERADGGTLFLDECGELSAAAQVRLLRILQDGNLERVGGEHSVRVDVRVLAATHRNLEAMAAAGQFRHDLWYRLAVFPIRLPPLRERTEDIAEMVTHFIAKAAQRLGIPPLTPSDEDARLLRSYSWPGNVRELAAVVERAVILSAGRRLDFSKALGGLPDPPSPASDAPEEAAVSTEKPGVEFLSLDAAAAQHIENALQRSLGRIEGPFGAARMLNINPHTLRSRMRNLGINWKRFRPPDQA